MSTSSFICVMAGMALGAGAAFFGWWYSGKESDKYPSGIEEEVCEDIKSRQRSGVEKYGVTVADNPLELKEWLQHAYEESLDNAIYLKRAVRQIEGTESRLETDEADQ